MNKMILNSKGEIGIYDVLFHDYIEKFDMNYFFENVIKSYNTHYDHESGRVTVAYKGEVYELDYSKKLKRQIENGENNKYYEYFIKKLNILIRKSILEEIEFMECDSKNESKLTFYKKVLKDEYGKTRAKIIRDKAYLAMGGVVSLATVATPYAFLKMIGGNVPVSIASSVVAGYFMAKKAYYDGDIGLLCDGIEKLKERIEKKDDLELQLYTVEEYLDELKSSNRKTR